jgi:hypothetical protein
LSGPSSSLINSQTQAAQQQNALTQQELQFAQQYAGYAQQQTAQGQQLMQPAINFNQAAASGNYQNLISAAAPQIGNVSNQFQQAQQNIRNNTPQGAGRDYALANLQTAKASDVSGLINNAFTSSLGNLAQIGGQYMNYGLQQQGATQSALGGAGSATNSAANIYGNVAQQQEQAKASTMQLLGGLGGGLISGVTGGLLGGKGGGGGSSPQVPLSTSFNQSPALGYGMGTGGLGTGFGSSGYGGGFGAGLDQPNP